MSTRVWLLRHAESEIPNIFHGAESDVGLSERGARQVQAAATILASYGANAVVSSGLRRALLTAEPIAAACGLPLRIEPELHERRVGILQGMPTRPPHPLWVETTQRWQNGETAYATQGAESFDDIRERIVPVWRRLTVESAEQSIIIVAHGVVIQVLLLSILPGYSPADWQRIGSTRNLGITELVFEADWRVIRRNEVPPQVAEIA